MHIINYQDRYFGGSAMMRLYEFDLDEGTVDVHTFSPYWQSVRASARPPLATARCN